MGEIASLVAALSWAVGVLWFRRILESESSTATNFRKCLHATLLFALVSSFQEYPPLTGTHYWMLAISGFVGMSVGDTLLFSAIRRLGTARALMLHATAPLFTVALAYGFQGESLTAWQFTGVVAATLGTFLVVGDRRSDGPVRSGRELVRGVLEGLGAALGQAIGLVLVRAVMVDLPEGSSYLPICALRLLPAAFVLFLMVWRSEPRALRDAHAFAQAGLPSFVGTFLGIAFMVLGLSLTKAGIVGALTATTPIWLVIISFLFLRVRFGTATLTGVIVGVLGTVLLIDPSEFT